MNIGIAAIIYLIIFLSSGWISEYYQIKNLENVLKVTAVGFLFSAMNVVPGALMTREMKFRQMAIISLVSSVIAGIIGITMALNNYGVWSIIAQQLITGLIGLCSYFLVTKWIPNIYFQLQSIHHMIRFGVFMFLSGLLEGVYSRIDVFLIAKVFSPASLGLYTRAQSLDSMIRSLSSASLLNVLFPTFAKLREDKEKLKVMYYQYFELISFVFCLMGGIFYILAQPLFLLLFGSKWSISADYFKILVLAGFAYPLSSLSLSIVEARGNSKNFFIVELIKKIIQLPIYFIAYFYGIKVRFVKFELNISVFKTIKFLSKYFFSTLLLVSLGELGLLYFQTVQPLLIAAIEAILFMLMYIGLHYQFKSKGYEYTLALLKQ